MRKKLLVSGVTLLVLALAATGTALGLVVHGNAAFKGVARIYQGNQYLATDVGQPVDASFLFIDGRHALAAAVNGAASLALVQPDDSSTVVDSYLVTVLHPISFSAAYSLDRIDVRFSPNLSVGDIQTFTRLIIDDATYDIGSLTIEGVLEIDEAILVGSAPFMESTDTFGLLVQNDTDSPVDVSSIAYRLNGTEYEGLCAPVNPKAPPYTVRPRENADFTFFVEDFASMNVTLRPKVLIRVGAQEIVRLPPVATEYTTSLSTAQIVAYLEQEVK